MPSNPPLSYIADLVRQYDRDRFLTALFAPKELREDLLTLYAFNVEIARIPETVSEPMIGQMRVQWWRDQLTEINDGKGPAKGHPVAEPLAKLIEAGTLPSELFFALLDSRAQDLAETSPPSMTDVEKYCQGTSGTLAQLGTAVLGASDEASRTAADSVGTAWALTGLARSVHHRAMSGHLSMLPVEQMQACGLDEQDLQVPDKAAKASDIIKAICAAAETRLNDARDHRKDVDRRALPVLMQATLATAYLKTLKRAAYRVHSPTVLASRPAVAKLWWNAWRKRY